MIDIFIRYGAEKKSKCNSARVFIARTRPSPPSPSSGGLLAQFIMQTLNAAPTDPLLSRRGTRHEWRFVTRAQDKLVPQTPVSAGGERESKAGQLRKPTLDASRPPPDKYVIQAASPACARVEMRSWPRKSAPHPLSTYPARSLAGKV